MEKGESTIDCAAKQVSREGFPLRGVAGIILIFWMGLSPFALNYLIFHPDERHYTDAGILMVQSGDYLTPRNADGTPRFYKPIVTYWLVAGSFHLFGISPMSARLPFLILGGVCVGLVASIAHRVFRDSRVTLLTAALLAVNPLMFLASTSTLPDVVQCCFLLLSACGWIGLLDQNRSAANCAMAFLGAGLAVATKGLPGALLLCYSLVFVLLNPGMPVNRKHLADWRWICLSGLIASSWYGAMIWLHGDNAIREFIGDQVHSRITTNWWWPVWQLPVSMLLYLVLIGPAAVVVFWFRGRSLQGAWNDLSEVTQTRVFYLWGWSLGLLPLMAFISPFTVRYFQLLIPFLTVIFAWGILHGAAESYRLWCRWSCPVLTGILGVGMALRLGMSEIGGFPVQLSVWLLFLVLSGGFLLRWLNGGVRTPPVSAATITQGLLATSVAVFWIFSPLGIPEQSETMAAFLRDVKIDTEFHDLWYVGKPALGAKLRMAIKGRMPVLSAESAPAYHLPKPLPVVISSQVNVLAQLDASEYVHLPISAGWRKMSPFSMFVAWCRRDIESYLATHQEQMVIAIPRSALMRKSVMISNPEANEILTRQWGIEESGFDPVADQDQ